MKKSFFILITSLFLTGKIHAQDYNTNNRNPDKIDSLKQRLVSVNDDVAKIHLLWAIGWNYVFLYNDSAATYAKEGLNLSQEIGYKYGEAKCYWLLNFSLTLLGNFTSALDFGMKNLSLSEDMRDTALIEEADVAMMNCYLSQGDYKEALKYGYKAVLLAKSQKINSTRRTRLFGMLGATYQKTKQLDSALYYCLQSFELNKKIRLNWSGIYLHIGDIYLEKGLIDLALDYYRKGIPIAAETFIYIDLIDIYNGMSKVFELAGKIDSSLYYAQKSIVQQGVQSYPEGQLSAASHLAQLYERKGKDDSTIKYLKLSITLREKLFSKEKTKEAQSFAFNQQIHQQELRQKLEQDELKYRNRLNLYIFLAGLLVLSLVAVGLWRRNVFRQKSFALLQQQKKETDNQKAKVEQTLEELRNTQSQLIQSEKMASLGELTAGIAHEIQNPLNFVNNFSEVNKELIAEMKDEMNKGNIDDANAIANDIIANEEKINLHGKRADAIVKGMMQHSQTITGKKDPTDINRLVDEYLRLVYQGLIAKNKTFNVTLQTDFDESIGNINIIPQDIGKVLMNLYNNAFYAVSEKKKQQAENYEPTVSIKTKKLNGKIEVSVKDNGNGIHQKIVDKIFQPFFTTKPTGQGTGLGLSLSYDIIKAHVGEIKVNTREGEFTEFVVQLPIVP